MHPYDIYDDVNGKKRNKKDINYMVLFTLADILMQSFQWLAKRKKSDTTNSKKTNWHVLWNDCLAPMYDLFMNEKVNDKLMNSSGKDQNKKRKLLTITYVCCLFVSLYDPFPYPSLLRITNP